MERQLRLFPEGAEGDEREPARQEQPAVAQPAPSRLTPSSSLAEALDEFDTAMMLKGFTDNTVAAFRADLRILAGFLSPSRPIGDISTRDLNNFLTYLLRGRGRPCNPKSYARRITTLKVFFGWLAESGARPGDPAAPLIHQPVSTPLPRVLSDTEIEQLRAAARQMMAGDKPDPRPALLLELLLSTGMKKSECMGIHLAHLDLTNPQTPLVHIRYQEARQHHKERTLRLPAGIVPLIRAYRQVYQPVEHLFDCTARNLEYVLRDLALAAGLSCGVSFEALRWTAALRDYQAGMDEQALRRKLGLSQLRWKETVEKLERLAAPPA